MSVREFVPYVGVLCLTKLTFMFKILPNRSIICECGMFCSIACSGPMQSTSRNSQQKMVPEGARFEARIRPAILTFDFSAASESLDVAGLSFLRPPCAIHRHRNKTSFFQHAEGGPIAGLIARRACYCKHMRRPHIFSIFSVIIWFFKLVLQI